MAKGTRAEAGRAADFVNRCTSLVAAAAAEGRGLQPGELAGLRELAASAGESGVALEDLVSAWLTAAWEPYQESLEGASCPQPGDRRQMPLAWQRAREATVALTRGYEAGQQEAIRREEAMRREFVDDLLDGRTDLGQLAERADRFSLRLVGPYTVTAARATVPFRAGDPATRHVEEGMATSFRARDVFITSKEGLLVCVSPTTETDVPRTFARHVGMSGVKAHQVAVSRSRPGPSGIVRSYQEVRGTLDIAERLALSAPVVDAADLLVFQVLGRDRAAITDLVATVLGTLEQARGGPAPLLDTLRAYCDTGCVSTATARRLGISVRAVTYRLGRIRQLTGYDPADPDQRYTLQTAALGARLLGWPAEPLERAD
ncbi:helix-turn-helix domain-containing protein [Streptomyces gobitricini]|uniref:Helix-turn-helix domain-containing protein n=1 Tax=Streptomyces gobitricini TaxID=68211 RepID=A0ABN3MCS5_9ACTN